MRARLRQVGNSIGLIVPASELRAISAGAGDIVELEIRQVERAARLGWNDPAPMGGKRGGADAARRCAGNRFR